MLTNILSNYQKCPVPLNILPCAGREPCSGHSFLFLLKERYEIGQEQNLEDDRLTSNLHSLMIMIVESVP